MLDTESCPECGKSIPVLAPRCEHCGANLAAGDEGHEAPVAAQISEDERISDEEYEQQERRYRRREIEEGHGTGGIIPYKNGPALAAYYCGVFAVIPCFPIGLVGFFLGLKGRKLAIQKPAVRGKVHAWIGIILGGLFGWGYLLGTIYVWTSGFPWD